MKKNLQIMNLLGDLNSRSSFNNIIEITLKIAITYIGFSHKKVYRFLQNKELEIEEFAIEAISPLFIKDKKDQNFPIQTSFKNWQPSILTEKDALFFLNKIIARRVEQHLYSVLREEDPFFGKILDSVNYLIKSQGLKKIHSFGRSYIVRNGYEIIDSLFIDHSEFEKIPSKLFFDKKTMFSNLLDYLETETYFVAAIPLNDLVYRLKHINFSEYKTVETAEMNGRQLEMNEIVDQALSYALVKLENSYSIKGKLNQSESNSFKFALTDICEDLKNGGVNPGLFDYMLPYMNGINKDTYLKKYNNILEYLLRVTKDVIADKLSEKI